MTEQEAIRYGEEYLHDLCCAACKVEDRHKEFVRMSINALEEIQQYRAIGTVEECRAAVEKKEVRNKAIDDFAETCKQDVMCQTFGLHPRNIDEIAEQLKGGGVDD